MKDEFDTTTADAFGDDAASSLPYMQQGSVSALCGYYQAVTAPKCGSITGRRFTGSSTPDVYRDAWQTPAWLFRFFRSKAKGFDIDAAASPVNALCEKFWTEADNSLSFDWPKKAKIWLNPPYSAILPWVQHAAEQASVSKCHVYMLIPDDCSTEWFRHCIDHAAEIYFLTHNGKPGKDGKSGRVAFVNALTGKEKNGNNKGSIIAVFRPHTAELKTFYIDRTYCEAEAEGFF